MDRIGHTTFYEHPELLSPELDKHDRAFRRFFQGAFDPPVIGVQLMYHLFYRATDGKLPCIDDAIKAQVMQEFGSRFSPEGLLMRTAHVEKMSEEQDLFKNYFEKFFKSYDENTLKKMQDLAKNPTKENKHEIKITHSALLRTLSMLTLSYEVISRQLQNEPQLELKSLAGQSYSLPRIKRKQCDRMSRSLVDNYKPFEPFKFDDVLPESDPDLLDFFKAIEQADQYDALAIRTTYSLLHEAADGRLPKIPDAVMARTLQDFGPFNTDEQLSSLERVGELMAKDNLELYGWSDYVTSFLQKLPETKEYDARCDLEHISLLYIMLGRAVDPAKYGSF